jgi:hypothetical protein
MPRFMLSTRFMGLSCGRGGRRRRLRACWRWRRRAAGSDRRRAARRSGAHCRAAAPGRCRRCRLSPNRKRRRAARRSLQRGEPFARSSARTRVAGLSSWPSSCFRYLSTRRLLSGWMSQAMVSAMRGHGRGRRVGGQQRRLGKARRLEIVDDREALRQRSGRRSPASARSPAG